MLDQANEAIDPMDAAASLIANSIDESDPPEDEEEQDGATDEDGEESEDADLEGEGATEAPKEVVFAGQKFSLPANTPPELVEQVAEVGKQLQGDYTRKTQELATHERQAAEFYQRELEAGKQRAEQAVSQVHAIVQTLGGILDPVQMEQLRHNNPDEWAVRYRMQSSITQAQQHASELSQQAQQAQAQAKEVAKREAWQRLSEEGIDRPTLEKLWGDAKGAYSFLSDERLGQVLDAESWLVLRDAIAYRNLKAQTPAISKRVAEAPKVPQAKTPMSQEVRERLDARKAVSKRGGASMRDLARFIATNKR